MKMTSHSSSNFMRRFAPLSLPWFLLCLGCFLAQPRTTTPPFGHVVVLVSAQAAQPAVYYQTGAPTQYQQYGARRKNHQRLNGSCSSSSSSNNGNVQNMVVNNWSFTMLQWQVHLERQVATTPGHGSKNKLDGGGGGGGEKRFIVFTTTDPKENILIRRFALDNTEWTRLGIDHCSLPDNYNQNGASSDKRNTTATTADMETTTATTTSTTITNKDDEKVNLALRYAENHQLLTASEVRNVERRWLERKILVHFYYSVLANETVRLSLTTRHGGNWLSPQADICTWVGISCGPLPPKALPSASSLLPSTGNSEIDGQGGGEVVMKILEPLPNDAVTAIQLPSLGLAGTIPGVLGQLKHLHKLRLDHNRLQGTLPEGLAQATTLRYIDLSYNQLEGPLPLAYGTRMDSLQYFSVQRNFLNGTLPSLWAWLNPMQFLDLSENSFSGTIPSQFGKYRNLKTLLLDDNQFTGHLPASLGDMTTSLTYLDVACNLLTGSIPSSLKNCVALEQLVVGANLLNGTFPSELLKLKNLQSLILSDNQFAGTLPDLDDWAEATNLGVLYIQDNNFTGSLPPKMFRAGKGNLYLLDLSRNHFMSTLPTDVGLMTGLHLIHAAGNKLTGSLPTEMTKLHKNIRLNFTDNLMTGQIPSLFCGQGSSTVSLLYHDFGCDAVLCPSGTFNIHGHATLHSGCRVCPHILPGQEKVLGRTSCGDLTNVYGDLDSDGVVSQREVLRLLFISTIGRFWGQKFQSWALLDKDECDLEGIVCVRGAVAKIDLTGAQLCTTGDQKAGSANFCIGLPSEIGLLTSLEILQLSRQPFLRGTIPTEIGQLTRLRHLDLSSSYMMSGTIPTEIGRLTNLAHFLISFCKFKGSMPSELFLLTRLEKLHLTGNDLTGTIPEEIHLSSLKELMISRNALSGTITSEIGHMTKLENFEIYGNQFKGTLPTELGIFSHLKRIDIFNNHFTGTIPVELASMRSLQILHGKLNDITGTIPSEFGYLPELSWIDFSGNYLHGAIPSSFGLSSTIRDFRVADNMLHEPVPESFCTNEALNAGATVKYGCDGVICSLGTYTESGYATEAEGGCIPCPKGQSTVYLGSTSCRTFDDNDLLSIVYAVMEGLPWPKEYDETWNKESDVCDWHGIECDGNGEIESLTIPVPF